MQTLRGVGASKLKLRTSTASLLCALLIVGCASSQQRNEAFDSYLELARIYTSNSDYPSARLQLERAQEIRLYDPRLSNAWALWHQVQNQREQAAEYFSAGLERFPGNPLLNNNYGVFLSADGKYKEAIVHFRRAAQSEQYPNRAYAWQNWGDAAMNDRQYDQALQAYGNALELAPKRWILLLKLARAHFSNAEFPQALEHMQRYMDSLSQLQISPSQSDLELGAAIATANKQWQLADQYRELM